MTKVSFSKYLENLDKNSNDFANVQENILKESGNYTKIRYSIITLSVQHLLKTQKDFGELLLFISLLDSQNIPRDLLEKNKHNVVVDNFLYHLKKYSLITNESSNSFHSMPVLSIHRNTQAITLAYLTKTLNLEKNKTLLDPIVASLENYIREIIKVENFSKMKLLISHCRMLLTHYYLLTDTAKASIVVNLGSIYFYLGNHYKAKKFLEEGLVTLNKCYDENHSRIVWALVHLGDVYRELGDYEKAKNLLEYSLSLCKKYLSENDINAARVLAHLGNVYRDLDDYDKAKRLLEQSIVIYKKYLSEDQVDIAWTLSNLGIVNKELGNYENAKDLLEESLIIFKKHFSENHVGVAWVLAHLGNLYENLGNYEKAKSLLELSLLIYKKHFPENHVRVSRSLMYLGNVYRDLGEYKKAKSLLEKSLITYENHYSLDHIETARVLRSLGTVYFVEGNMETSENLLSKALGIFQKNKHPEIYISLENLAELYSKKSMKTADKGDTEQSQKFKKQAILYLRKALEVIKAHFPADSPHILRIQSKLKSLEL